MTWLAGGMAGLVIERLTERTDGQGLDAPRNVFVTWAPTTSTRRRARGFDQAEVLAGAVVRALRATGTAARGEGLLVRTTSTAQTGGSVVDRTAHDRVRFAVRPVATGVPNRFRGATIVLVDDVVTTGATLAAAASALRLTSARVIAVTAAATPLKGRG